MEPKSGRIKLKEISLKIMTLGPRVREEDIRLCVISTKVEIQRNSWNHSQ